MGGEYFSAPDRSAPVWELSGWWRRVGAFLIDFLLIAVPVNFFLSALGVSPEATLTQGRLPNELDGVSWLLGLVASSIYYALVMPATNGQTVGKRITGIRVVRENGATIGARYALLRQTLVIALLFDSILVMFIYIPTVLNFLWPLWDEKHQALHDKIVRSRVVRADALPFPRDRT